MSSSLLDSFFDIIFPKYCVRCEKLNTFLCGDCYEWITFFSTPFLHKKLSKMLNTECYVDQVWPMGNYTEPLSNLIKTYKYKKVQNIGSFLGRMMYHTMALPLFPHEKVIFTCIPLHKKRFQKRGFNQAELIAKKLAQLLTTQMPRSIYLETLIRTKHSKPQAKIKQKEIRLKRLQATFALSPNITSANLENSIIFLIDDVFTTGTTLNECARILKENGAKKVIGITVAHEG